MHHLELTLLIDDPTSVFSLLGQSVPVTGTFFINYVMLQS